MAHALTHTQVRIRQAEEDVEAQARELARAIDRFSDTLAEEMSPLLGAAIIVVSGALAGMLLSAWIGQRSEQRLSPGLFGGGTSG